MTKLKIYCFDCGKFLLEIEEPSNVDLIPKLFCLDCEIKRHKEKPSIEEQSLQTLKNIETILDKILTQILFERDR